MDVTDGDELIARLLGFPNVPAQPISGELRLERTIEALVAWVVALGRTRPVVLLIEDLHWCDPTTLDAVQRLIERIGDSPVLVLLTARPEFEPRWGVDSRWPPSTSTPSRGTTSGNW